MTKSSSRYVVYGDSWFEPKCPRCGKYVKPDETVMMNAFGKTNPAENATCRKCGRVEMLFIGNY